MYIYNIFAVSLFGQTIFRSIIDDRYYLTQTLVSSRNRTCDSPGLSNTGRCYLSSPSAIYFWRLMEFRCGVRERKREKENGREGGKREEGVTHTNEETRRAAKREGVNAFWPINALESRFSHFFPIKSLRNSSPGRAWPMCHRFYPRCTVRVLDSAKLIEIRSHPRRRKLETTLRN